LNDDRRVAGGLIALVAIVLGWVLTGAMSTAPPVPGAGAAAGQVTGGEGAALYLQSCAACHGPGGVGSAAGPPLIGVGAAAADFMLRTGRMPLSALATGY
jgi:ubiquinol-cytochrome c reductase cytochrome c subunit